MYVDVLSELEEIDGEKPWADFVFDLTNVEEDQSGELRIFTARALHEQTPVGIKIAVPKGDWSEQVVDETFTVYWNSLWFVADGEESRRLVKLYADYWGIEIDDAKIRDRIRCYVVSLGTDPQSIEENKLDMKAFFDPRVEGDSELYEQEYGELFINVDMPNSRIELREKDTSYRRIVVGWLTGRLPTKGPLVMELGE